MTNIYLLVQDKIYNKVKRRIFCWHEVNLICDLMGQNQSHVAIFSYGVKYTRF